MHIPANSSTFKVVYAAHTVLLKGLHYLLKAWHEFKGQGELIVIGGIDPAVKNIIDRDFSNLTHVKFIGVVQGIDSYIKDASVLVCPSLIDGGPVTVLEAMRYGVPAILTEACGVKDFIRDGETGWIIPSANEHELLKKITWCSENREEARTMGIRAQRELQQYDFDAFIEKIGNETLALQKL